MSSLKKNLESFKGGNADSNKRDMKAIQRCWKRMKLQTKKKFDEQWRERKKTGGGKAPASPNAISKLVADGIPASGQQPCDWRHWWTRTKCPMQYADYQLKPGQKTNTKAKEKSESIRCRVSEFAIFNYPLFYLFIYFLTICKINNLKYSFLKIVPEMHVNKKTKKVTIHS